MSIVSHFKRISIQLYTQFVKLPTYTLGRWKLEEPHVAMRKADWSTEDHCGCDEMRMKYLYEKERLEELIEQYKIIEQKAKNQNKKL